mmetsp:Transcript_19105/g.24082  ORF Transcript_19105/g.24082 Transcript_19105/m.24082 type:complete len:107 (-) Transcript_19105:110-430(-)
MSGILSRAADVLHKTTVTGLFGVFGFGLYTVTNQVMEGKNGGGGGNGSGNEPAEHPQAGFINMLKTKAEEEYKKYYKIDHREWYDKDDDSYLKQIPRPEEYAPKKK